MLRRCFRKHSARRTLINAGGSVPLAPGAMECALGNQLLPIRPLVQWFGIIGAISAVAGRVQNGRHRGRLTSLVVIGDGATGVSFFTFAVLECGMAEMLSISRP